MCAVLKTSKKNQKNPMCAVFSLFFLHLCVLEKIETDFRFSDLIKETVGQAKKHAFSPFQV